MADIKMPNLDNLYREEGLRNNNTLRDGRQIDALDPFYSLGDVKRELRGLFLVPYIATREVLGQLVHAVDRLIVGTFQLLTLDGRCFTNLYNMFVHVANALYLVCEGIYDTLGTGLALYFRTLATFVDVIEKLFENEPTDPAQLVQPTINIEPVRIPEFEIPAPKINNVVPLYPSLDLESLARQDAPIRLHASSSRFFTTRAGAPAAAPSLMQAIRDLENMDDLSEEDRVQMVEDMIASGDYSDDRPYVNHSRM